MSCLHLAIRIRSENEDDTFMGHVEVNVDKKEKWQKLESRNWTMDDAKVVCREAGYEETLEYINAISYPRRKERYPAIFPVHDNEVDPYPWNKKCTGDEYSILRCNPHSDTSGTNDAPTVGVGVRCKIPGEIKHDIVYFYFNFIPEKFFVSACDMLFTPH